MISDQFNVEYSVLVSELATKWRTSSSSENANVGDYYTYEYIPLLVFNLQGGL
jgi:hypothetical protein